MFASCNLNQEKKPTNDVLEEKNTNICCQKLYSEIQRSSMSEQGQMDYEPQRGHKKVPCEARKLRIWEMEFQNARNCLKE